METDYYNFCFNIYSAEYNRCYNESKSNFQNEAISETIEREWDKNAQKSAIQWLKQRQWFNEQWKAE